jgi:hypothetical protein
MTLITSIVGLKFESLVVGLSLMLFSNLGGWDHNENAVSNQLKI